MSPAKLPELVTGLVYAVAPMAAALHGLRDGDVVTAAAYAVAAMGVGMGLVIVGTLACGALLDWHQEREQERTRARCLAQGWTVSTEPCGKEVWQRPEPKSLGADDDDDQSYAKDAHETKSAPSPSETPNFFRLHFRPSGAEWHHMSTGPVADDPTLGWRFTSCDRCGKGLALSAREPFDGLCGACKAPAQ